MSDQQMVNTTDKPVGKPEPRTLKGMLADVKVKNRFEEILGKKAPGFISSIISAVQANSALQECEPGSVIGAAVIAASLDLPINPSLGQAHIVPYSKVAQFQMGWKGYVQLAQRTRQYAAMNATEVYEGQLVKLDSITGDMQFDAEAKKSDKVIGYLFYFRLLSGFEKYTYMTVEQCHAHGKRYSKSYSNPKGKWQLDFPSMALKTVVKMGLSKWGPLSTEMQTAVTHDQAVVK
jgi:recombination protein RecT